MLVMTNVTAQSKKDIRDNKIVSETSFVTTMENGKETTYKESYTIYDKKGCVTEQTEYTKEGAIKRKETNKYNINKDKTEEVVYDGKDKTTQKTTFLYNANGQKIAEIESDGSGKIMKQSMILYNANGLKTEKKTYDANKKPISSKKYTYSTK
jgi:hypothetical protein